MNQKSPKPCAVEGCRQIARDWSRWCPKHGVYITRHGHAEGRVIRAHELKPFRELATRLLDTYSERRDVQAALTWLDRLLASAPNAATSKELRRLRSGGVTAHEVLHVVLALWAYHLRFPGSLPDDARLTYALGRAIVRLRKQQSVFGRRSLKRRGRYVSNESFRTLGLLIREALPVLLTRLVRLNDAARDESAALLKAIRAGDPSDPADLLRRERT